MNSPPQPSLVARSTIGATGVPYIAINARTKRSTSAPRSRVAGPLLVAGGIVGSAAMCVLHVASARADHASMMATADIAVVAFTLFTLTLVGLVLASADRFLGLRDPIATASVPMERPATWPPLEVSIGGRARNMKRVLYVDESGSGRYTTSLRRIFAQRHDVELIVARPGALALDSARFVRPDIVLLDLGSSGELLMKQLRQSPECSDLPIIALTANASPDQVDRILAGGAYAHIPRPMDIEHFRAMLDRVFAVRQAA
ncbi:MAG TPA: response regulator [Gemmatimonadaceae bacterium]|jgi:CheY-like chemotaxis protein|nr:response regulator [Gemmatimonadaceae bacterium]